MAHPAMWCTRTTAPRLCSTMSSPPVCLLRASFQTSMYPMILLFLAAARLHWAHDLKLDELIQTETALLDPGHKDLYAHTSHRALCPPFVIVIIYVTDLML